VLVRLGFHPEKVESIAVNERTVMQKEIYLLEDETKSNKE
jgi:hypothetical protein